MLFDRDVGEKAGGETNENFITLAAWGSARSQRMLGIVYCGICKKHPCDINTSTDSASKSRNYTAKRIELYRETYYFC